MTVRAAGGLVVRSGHVLLVLERGRRWGLPKGRLKPGETKPEAAIREVLEETGCLCRLEEKLPLIRYIDGRKKQKTVQFWKMSVIRSFGREPDEEIADVAWLPIEDAAGLVHHRHQSELIATYA